jgi:hypothetical protein
MTSGSGRMPICPASRTSDSGAQAGPLALRQVELAGKIEQGDLADLFAGKFRGDET